MSGMAESGKAYRLRAIEADDLDYLTEIIAKLDVEALLSCLDGISLGGPAKGGDGKNKGDGQSLEDAGLKFMARLGMAVCKNYRSAKRDVHALLARLSGMDEEEVARLPLTEFTGMVMELFNKREFADSFSLASSFAG